MIAHQYITVKAELMPFLIPGKNLKIFPEVILVPEYIFSAIAARYYVIERAFVLYSWFPCHVPIFNQRVFFSYDSLHSDYELMQDSNSLNSQA